MGSGESKIEALSNIEFRGSVGKQIAQYAKATQRIGHDLAYALDNDAGRARSAMHKLKKHPLLLGVDVRIRARLVARHLRRAHDCARGISAEAVKFNLEYRKQFLGVDNKNGKYKGEVDL
jgi:hypothetical protein